jgi:hypothetical protein
LSQPDMEWEMVSPPAGAFIPSFTIYHLYCRTFPGTLYPVSYQGLIKIYYRYRRYYTAVFFSTYTGFL